MRKKTLAILLVLCMALTLLPGMAMAEGEAVAQIGTKSYPTLAAAVTAAKTGETVTLLKTTSGPGVKISAPAKSITIDLNDCTYTVTDPTVGSPGTETNGFQLIKGNTVTFKNGTLKAGSSAQILLQNYCNLTLENVTVDCRESAQCQYALSNNCGNIILKGNTNIYAATEQCAFDLWYGMSETYDEGVFVTIDESMTGTIRGKIKYGAANRVTDTNWTKKAKLEIKAGTFETTFCDGNTGDLGLKNANIVITGGAFSEYLPEMEVSVVHEGKEYFYPTLTNAVATAKNGSTIKLLEDVTEDVVIPSGKKLTLDLNGKKLTNKSGHTIFNEGTLIVTGTGTVDNITHAKAALHNGAGATATLNGGTFDRSAETGTANNVSGSNSWYTITNQGTMTINNGVTVTQGTSNDVGKFSSLIRNGGVIETGTATLTINGGTFNRGLYSIKNDLRGILNINNGTFDNHAAGGSLLNYYKAVISGGTFTATESKRAVYNVSGVEETGTGDLTISGGSFTVKSDAEFLIQVYTEPNAILTAKAKLAGGTFSKDPTEFVASGYQVQKNADGTFTVFYPYVPPVEPPVVDVPVGDGEGSVSVPVQVDKDKGEASLVVDDKKLNEIVASGETSGTVAIDMSGLDSSVKTANLPAKTVTAINEAVKNPENKTENLSVALPAATIEFDAASLGEVAKAMKQAPEAPVAISAQQVKVSALPANQQTIVGKDALVLDLSVQVGDKKVESFGSGSVSVTVKYTPKEGEDTNAIAVWFLSDDGKLTPCRCKYENGKLSFTTGHFSKYVVGDFPFTDVKGGEWYYENVVYAYVNGIIKGVTPTQFDPAGETSRAMVVTMLWRIAGSPASTEGNAFSDVPSDSYYAKAVAWAAEKEIVAGNGDGTFSPETAITREQLAAILHRYSGKPAAGAGQLEFPDAEKVSDWAEDAILWAVTKGLIQGSDGKLMPQGVAQRCQVAAILQRMDIIK